MRNRTLHPRQLQIIRRLQVVGCPLDYEYLSSRPTYPLRVVTEASDWGTNLFSMPGGTGLLLPLRIVASVRITISRFDLRAEWLKTPITWASCCRQHSRYLQWFYCLHGTSSGDIQVTWERTLNHRTGENLLAAVFPGIPDGGVLKRYTEIKGTLVGAFPYMLPATVGAKLEATLYIADLMGEEYPYPVVIENTQPVARDKTAVG
jgi:hypothetical protein